MSNNNSRKLTREPEVIKAQDTQSKMTSSQPGKLQLGVKGKLSNNEMELLRQKVLAYISVLKRFICSKAIVCSLLLLLHMIMCHKIKSQQDKIMSSDHPNF